MDSWRIKPPWLFTFSKNVTLPKGKYYIFYTSGEFSHKPNIPFTIVFTFILKTTNKEKGGDGLVFRVRVVASSDDDDAVEEMIGWVYGGFD